MGRARRIFTKCFPYLIVVILAAFANIAPIVAFFILAAIHLTTIDTVNSLEKQNKDGFSDWLVKKATAIDGTRRFTGENVIVTNEQTWRVKGKCYIVSVRHCEECHPTQGE